MSLTVSRDLSGLMRHRVRIRAHELTVDVQPDGGNGSSATTTP